MKKIYTFRFKENIINEVDKKISNDGIKSRTDLMDKLIDLYLKTDFELLKSFKSNQNNSIKK